MNLRIWLTAAVIAEVLFFTLVPIVPLRHGSPEIHYGQPPPKYPPFAYTGSFSFAYFGTGMSVNGRGEWRFEVNVCTPTNILC